MTIERAGEAIGMTSGAERPEVDLRRTHESLDEQARRKGVRPLRSIEDLHDDDAWPSEEELQAFLAHVAASRHADLA